MKKTYNLNEHQFNELVNDSNITLLSNLDLNEVKKFESLLVPQFLQYYPGATNDFIKIYLNTIQDYKEYLQNTYKLNTEDSKNIQILKKIRNISGVNKNEFINDFSNFCDKHNNYKFSSFLEKIPNDRILNNAFQKYFFSNTEHIVNNSNQLSFIIDIIKLTLQSSPLEVIEKNGVLQLNATVEQVLAKIIKEDFNIVSDFAYPEYVILNDTYDDIFDIPYPNILVNDDSIQEMLLLFNELLKDNSTETFTFFEKNKNILLKPEMKNKLIETIAINSINLDRNIQSKLFTELLTSDNPNINISEELQQFQLIDSQIAKNKIEKKSTNFAPKVNANFKFIKDIELIFQTPFETLYNLNSFDLNKVTKSHEIQYLFTNTLKNTTESKEFLEISEIIAKNKQNKIIADIFKLDVAYTVYPFLSQEIKTNLSSNILDTYLNKRKNNQITESQLEYNQGKYIHLFKKINNKPNLDSLFIYETIPLYNAIIKNVISYEQFFEVIALPEIDINNLYRQPQVKLLINHIIQEILKISEKDENDLNKAHIISIIYSTKLPKILFHLMDKFVTEELNNPTSKIQDYSSEEKLKLSLFKKENFINFKKLLITNKNPDVYYLDISIAEAISDVLKEQPNFYKGKASELSDYEIQKTRGIINISKILSEDFRELINNGNINKIILNDLLMTEAEIFSKLPNHIKNSPQAFEITRSTQFFQQITGGNCPDELSLTDIYNINDAEFLLKQLNSIDYEHAPDFTNRNSELLTILPKETIESPEFWANIIKKEIAFFGSDFTVESTVFDVIPKKVLKSTELFNMFINNYPAQTISLFPKQVFDNKENTLKFLNSLSLDNNFSMFESFLKDKIPKISILYKNLNKSDDSKANLKTIENILIIANEKILNKTIEINIGNKNIVKPLKF